MKHNVKPKEKKIAQIRIHVDLKDKCEEHNLKLI